MNSKKIMMIVLLIIFVVGLGIALVKINDKSTEKLSDNSNNTTVSSNKTQTKSGVIRKSSEIAEANSNNMVQVTDNFFIEQTNDMYYNLEDYIGKTIKMEGLIYTYQDSNGDTCYAVVRNTPGCCGSDGLAGIDIRYNGEYPEENAWVEVVGVMGTDIVYGDKVPAIQISSIEEKPVGTTFVTN